MTPHTETQIAPSTNTSLPGANHEKLAYSVKETCQILGGIDRGTLYRLEKRGLIRPVPHIRRNRIFTAKEINRFLEIGGRN